MLKPMFALFALLSLSFFPQQPAAAPAQAGIPADAAKMVNPVKPTAESQAQAKKVYGYDCAMCHGEKGDGKGDLVGGYEADAEGLHRSGRVEGPVRRRDVLYHQERQGPDVG